MYCIYTDSDVPQAEGNLDHIIPKSLGGCDEFTVWSDRDFNAKMGHEVDGAMANDPLMQIVRSRSSVRGHSGNDKPQTWKHADINGRPGQMAWTQDGLRLWDSRNREYIDDDHEEIIPVKAKINIDTLAATRFVTKVALGGAHFFYGDVIRSAIDCDVLRKLTVLDAEEARLDQHLRSSGVSICDRVHPDGQAGEGAVYRAFCESIDRSIFISVPHDDGITFAVGLLGAFIGAIMIPGDGTAFPMDAQDHDLGRVALLAPGEMELVSYRELAVRFYRTAYGEEPPPPPG